MGDISTIGKSSDKKNADAAGKKQSPFFKPVVQPKLSINAPDNIYEQEADSVANKVMNSGSNDIGKASFFTASITPIQRKCEHCEEEEKKMQRKGTDSSVADTSVTESYLTSLTGGQSLNKGQQHFFESGIGYDFSNVRLHTDSAAAQSAAAVNARAYTHGNNIVFGSGQYQPETDNGKRLLAHELTHTVQQSSMQHQSNQIQRDRYTPEERRAMREGRVTGTQEDLDIGSSHGFEPGDIVFRLGSRSLADRIHNPVTHGGIYLGDGLIHDMVGFGNRTVRASLFYREADDPTVVRVMRFTGPYSDIIISRLIRNIRARDFRLPTDPKPWNLFSSSDDYRTATCLEYSHAQILYAIRQLSTDTTIAPDVRAGLMREYFAPGAVDPRALIAPQTLTIEGQMGIAINERRALVAAATASGDTGGDIDSSVFENRWEGQESLRNVGSDWAPVFWQTETLRSFTYQSFVDSRQYFRVVNPPVGDFPQTPPNQRSRFGMIETTEEADTDIA
jgi:hypothetical protein